MENWNTIHNELLSITRVSLILNCSVITIKRWYKWANEYDISQINGVSLPQYTTDNRGTWFFTYPQVNQLREFRKHLKWGQMSKFNCRYYNKKKGE